jgi:putative transposase
MQARANNASTKIGVDLGVLRFATLSTGEQIESPMPLKKLGKKLAKLQWRNRNKEIRSNNWRKAQTKIAKLHSHIANIRKDFIHKLTTKLAIENQAIVIEDLNISGMLANHKLAKAISDCRFYEFRQQLTYKTQLYGSELIVADRWFPSSKTCNNCRCKKQSLSLSDRIFKCDDCGCEIDRDWNASLNLAAY